MSQDRLERQLLEVLRSGDRAKVVKALAKILREEEKRKERLEAQRSIKG